MAAIALILLFFIFLFGFIAIITNLTLLHGTFISKKLKKQPSLTMFYVRFGLDIFLAFSHMLTNIFTVLKTLNLIDSYNPYLIHIFWINFSIQCAMATRGTLVIIITLDRTLAVFSPIFHHNYRERLPNFGLISFLLFLPIWNNFYLWVICEFHCVFESGCIEFLCMMGSCYGGYAYNFELVAHLIILLTSLALAVKLFVWNNFKTGAKSKDIERANYLALMDVAIIIVFDLIPILFAPKLAEIEDLQPVFGMCRVGGYAFEAFLVRRVLRRRNDIRAPSSVRLSGARLSTVQIH